MKKICRLVSFIFLYSLIASSQVDSPVEVKAMHDEHSSRLISASPSDRYCMRTIIHHKLQLELCALLEPARLSNNHIRVPDVPYHNVDRFVCFSCI